MTSINRIGSLVFLALLFACPPRSATAEETKPNQLTPEQIVEGWISLFDGETLFGWTPTSKANWKVEDGTIAVSEGDEGFLMTNSEFGDYELHVEFKAPATTNSGVFLRTPLKPTDPAKDCIELNIAPKEDPFPTASLVGRLKVALEPESYRVDDPKQPTRRVGGPGRAVDAWKEGWHAFDLVLEGSTVRISLDGVLLTTYIANNNSVPLRGRIGLQFREGPVAFRNIRLKPLGLKPMLNGKNLAGWNDEQKKTSTFEIVSAQDSSGSLPLEGRAGEGGEGGTRSNPPSLTLPSGGRGPEETKTGDFELRVTNGSGPA
jgi:hypothetical protein